MNASIQKQRSLTDGASDACFPPPYFPSKHGGRENCGLSAVLCDEDGDSTVLGDGPAVLVFVFLAWPDDDIFLFCPVLLLGALIRHKKNKPINKICL